jgi:hypothetical protein
MLLAVSLLAVLTSVGPAAPKTLAVLPVRADGLPSNDVQRFASLLRQSAAKNGFEVQDEATTTSLVDASQSLGVDTTATAGALKLGALADVRFVVVSRMALSEQGSSGVSLQLMDVNAGTQVREVVAAMPLEPVAMQAAFAAVGEDLFGNAPLSQIKVTVNAAQPDANTRITIDGLQIDGEMGGVVPGKHVVNVVRAGFSPQRVVVDVQRGEPAVLNVVMASTAPVVHAETSSFPVMSVGGGVAFAAAVGAGVGAYFSYGEATVLKAVAVGKTNDPNQAVFDDAVGKVSSQNTITVLCGVGAGVLAAAGAALIVADQVTE